MGCWVAFMFRVLERDVDATSPVIQRLGFRQEAHRDLSVVVIDDISVTRQDNLDRWWEQTGPSLPWSTSVCIWTTGGTMSDGMSRPPNQAGILLVSRRSPSSVYCGFAGARNRSPDQFCAFE